MADSYSSCSIPHTFHPSMVNNPNPNETNPEFVKSSDDIEKCTACHKILWDPFQLPCGHHVCPVGLDRVLEEGRCLVMDCKLPCSSNQIFADACKRREIGSLEVRCGYQACKKIIKWKELEKHMESCEYREVTCDKCCELVKMYNMEKHLDEDCVQRILHCPEGCGYSTSAINMSEHLSDECPNVILSCPNECGMTQASREQLRNHVTECPLRRVACRFKDVGCPFEGLNDDIHKHSEDAVPYHLELIALREEAVENVTRSHIDDMKLTIEQILRQGQEVKKIKDENEKLKKDCQINRKSIQDLKKVLVTQGEKVIVNERHLQEKASTDGAEKIKSELSAVKDMIDGTKQRLETVERATGSVGQNRGEGNAVERAEKQVRLMDVRVCEIDLRLQLFETINYNGVLMWKIRDYRRRKMEAVNGRTLSLYSQPFYTSQYGYKLCGRVYLNGDGTGKGAYLSFFVVVMKGDFDALLPWPFMLPVTFMLLDQNGTGLHERESFTPNPTSNSFHKPTTEMNVACGVPRFVSHTKLESDTYLKEDIVFLRIVVDCTNANYQY
ncbi:TNF receptor-associated factor 3-like [Ylistrum balloti]|uniref:TNF receptor-associated factor 3-like n=1 Tax=Ylistrum balloti TaxID=509963 RepID=UPI002905F751|nr:TNF receptor-associated factor 3-like [Ylistrum balloti]